MCDVNKQFFQGILRANERDESVVVTGFSAESACGKGNNFTSEVKRVVAFCKKKCSGRDVVYNRHLFIKLPLESELLRDTYRSETLFANEVLVYNNLVHVLQEYTARPLAFAECIYASKDVIVLEDLCAKGYQMVKDVSSLSVDQSISVIKEFATLHSASINLRAKDLKTFDELRGQTKDIFTPDNANIKQLMRVGIETSIVVLKENPRAEFRRAEEILESKLDTFYDEISDSLSKDRDMSVYTHGDCWMNNMLFKTEDGVIKTKLIDLQISRLCSAAADLTYFLYVNLEPETRSVNMQRFLQIYLENLHECLTKMGLEKEKDMYTKEWLCKEMKEFQYMGLAFALWFAPMFFIDKGTFPDLQDMDMESITDQSKLILDHISDSGKERIYSLVLEYMNNTE